MEHPVRVWLGGEGPSEIGNRDWPDGERVGMLEALLRRVEPDGWRVGGATRWVSLRKFEVGAAIGRVGHGDEKNVLRLVNKAFEEGCEVVAFTRDVDADPARADAIRAAIARARAVRPEVDVIGGAARPAIEGWVLALLGVPHTQQLSRDKANALLAEKGHEGKNAESYVAVAEAADTEPSRLPAGCDGLCQWLKLAQTVLGRAIRGD